MPYLSEEERVKKLIALFKKRYPRAVALKKDKNLVGKFLEVLVDIALCYSGYLVYKIPGREGDKGIDIKLIDDSFAEPLCFAIECMNGRYDYTEKYFDYLKKRISNACFENHNPIIICVDRKKNFERFKGSFACKVYFVELGKQYHPKSTTYSDYLKLKEKLKDIINKIARTKRPEEMAGREYLKEYETPEELIKAWEEAENEELERIAQEYGNYEELKNEER